MIAKLHLSKVARGAPIKRIVMKVIVFLLLGIASIYSVEFFGMNENIMNMVMASSWLLGIFGLTLFYPATTKEAAEKERQTINIIYKIQDFLLGGFVGALVLYSYWFTAFMVFIYIAGRIHQLNKIRETANEPALKKGNDNVYR
ncbi:MAG: putative membrane channel-forming protein YqfA (hemolysin III family) [Psychromonas sp.]